MKKWFNIAVLAVLVSLAACTKVENAPEVKETISYTVGSYAQATKATTAFPTSLSFKSSAWLHDGGSAAGSVFYAAETISWDGATWAPSHDYYWPKNPESYINFISWYDATGTPEVTETSITWTNRTIGAADDILVADKAWRQQSNYDYKYYRPGIPTLFRHQLARIVVRAKMSVDTETVNGVTTTWAVAVKNFQINNIYTQGTLALTNNVEPEADSDGLKLSAWTGSWTVGGSATNIAGSASQALNASDFVDIVPARSVIPQATSPVTMSFSYEVTTTSSKSGTTHTLVETVDVPALALDSFQGYTGDWERNKIITYSITINPVTGVITILPTVVAWETESNSIMVE